MNQPDARHHGTVPVSHHQFFLLDDGTYPEDGGRLSWHDNGLATTAPGILAITTGIHTGPVELVVERHTSAPPPQPDPWEDIAEVTVHTPTGRLHITALMTDVPAPLRAPITDRPGPYRARVHATGRDTAVDLAVLHPVEHYLIQLWPTTQDTNTTLIKATSTYSASRRS